MAAVAVPEVKESVSAGITSEATADNLSEQASKEQKEEEATEPEDLIGSMPILKDITDLDTKVIEYLRLLDKYTRLSAEYRDQFKNGFINLSRANYASNRRFNKDFYDHREVSASVNIAHRDGEFELVDYLKIQKQKQSDAKRSEKVGEKAEQRDGKSELHNRKKKSQNLAGEQYKDPIKMFGAFVPYQLKDSQKCFQSALHVSIELINTKKELQLIYKEIKQAKKGK